MLADITAALRRGDAVAALSAANAAIEAEPNNAQAHHLLGLARKRNGDLDGARSAIDQAISLAPDRAMFQLSRASLLLSDGDLEAAEQGMKDAVALDPNHLPAYVGLAHMALSSGRNDDAGKYLKLAQRVDPQHPQVLVVEGHVAQLGGRADHALQCFTAAVNAEPGYALAQVSLGLAYLQRGHWAFAEQALRNALALDANNLGVLRGLAEACRRQKKFAEAEAALDQLVARQPEINAYALRGEMRLAQDKAAEAAADWLWVLDQVPEQDAVLGAVIPLLLRLGRGDEALARCEAALTKVSHTNLWNARLRLCQNTEQTLEVLERWHQREPENSICIEQLALHWEARGEGAKAQELADRALSKDPARAACHFLKAGHELLHKPSAVLRRMDLLAKGANSAPAKRMVLAWQGLAHDRLGDYEQATRCFAAMISIQLPQCPLPKPQPATDAPAEAVQGRALWAPPGLRLERVLSALQPQLGRNLLVDRLGNDSRGDGFGLMRFPAEDAKAGRSERWAQVLAGAGLVPAEVVDVLPQFDAYTATALAGLKFTAVVADPRDVLLNWLVFGNVQGYQFVPDPRITAEWLALALAAVADQRDAHPETISVVAFDNVDSAPGDVAAALQAALGLAEAPSADVLGRAPKAIGGMPNQFPAGHWRHYSKVMADAFARLVPVAQRFGYPAE